MLVMQAACFESSLLVFVVFFSVWDYVLKELREDECICKLLHISETNILLASYCDIVINLKMSIESLRVYC